MYGIIINILIYARFINDEIFSEATFCSPSVYVQSVFRRQLLKGLVRAEKIATSSHGQVDRVLSRITLVDWLLDRIMITFMFVY